MTYSSEQSPVTQPLAVEKINFDVLLELCDYASGGDFVNLLSTCQTLNSYTKEQSIWRKYCTKYHFRDLSPFPQCTWYQVYTVLLHKYGPLIGLWANDHPFKGTIMEVRLDSSQSSPSIVAEVWRFRDVLDPGDLFALDQPHLPDYWEVLRIRLQTPKYEKSQQNASVGKVEFQYYNHDDGSVIFSTDESQIPSFQYLSATNQSTFVQDHYQDHYLGEEEIDIYQYCHPEFPDPQRRPWYDDQREPPRVPQEPSIVIENSRCFDYNGRYLYTAVSETTKPWAISFMPPFLGGSLHDPPTRWKDRRYTIGKRFEVEHHIHPRYYPLRSVPPPQADAPQPGEVGWTPALLEGLWLGAYSTHGTEVLFLEWVADEKEVRAFKVTGDTNVPRGVNTWTFSIAVEENEKSPSIEEFGNNMEPCPVYWAIAQVSEHGFFPDGRDTLIDIIALVSNNELHVRWKDFNSTAVVKRYPGRNFATEKASDDTGGGILIPADEW